MRGVGEMPGTGTFFDIDPDNWKEYVSVPVSSTGDGGCHRPTQPEVKKTSQAPTSLGDVDYAPFWQAHLDLVNTWARYQAAKKMEISNSYPETEHKVAHVVDGYWSGSSKKLHQTVEYRSSLVDEAIKYCDAVCKRFQVESVSRDWLYENLLDGPDYASYRGKINRRMARNKPAQSLKVL